MSARAEPGAGASAARRIPIAVKIAYTLFMMVLVPFYWHQYGPTNFLYFCDIALFFTLAAVWLESPLLASIPAVGIFLPQMLWVADFFAMLLGGQVTGMTAYMFDWNDPVTFFVRALSSFHGWLPFFLLWIVWRLGYDRRAFWSWTVLTWIVLPVCYVFMPPPPAPADHPDLPVNINYVYGTSDEAAQPWMHPHLWFALLMVFIPVCLVLPMHLILNKTMRPAGDNRRDYEEPAARLLRLLLWVTSRCTLSLRYRIEVSGLEKIDRHHGPFLILPNHPGYMDPPIMLTLLWPKLRPRPMLFEGMFQNPLMYPLMKLLNALRVPDLSKASAKAKVMAQEAIAGAVEALQNGENVILWPAGRVYRTGHESLGGTRAVSDILQAVPAASIVLVRTRGLWGSRWTYAWTGEQPNMGGNALTGIGWLLANLLFFMPRRTISITVEPVDRPELPDLRREVLNPWLENWYNAPGPETPTFVPYHWLFGPRSHEYPQLERLADADLARIKPETRAAVAELIGERVGRALEPAELKPTTTLDQLGLDSLDAMELTLAVEQRFGFHGDEAPKSVGQLWALAEGLVERKPPRPPSPEWFRPGDGGVEIQGETVALAFVNRTLAAGRTVAVADDLAGVVNSERLLTGAILFSRRFAGLPAPNVGLLLPSSVACDLVLFGLYLAGKLPVVMNWTTGPVHLGHAVQTMGLSHVVTSQRFVDRLGVTIPGVEFLYLEDLREQIGTWERLRTLMTVRLRPGSIRRLVPKADPDQPAVVLFTSGSERAPKAVPLTHRNLLTNQRSCLAALGIKPGDSLLSFLPAFHSFGLSAGTLLPLLAGVRTVHHPDPTDAAGLVRKIAAYRPTLLLGTPTFVSYICSRAQPGDLDSLRLIMVGAEKCPPPLFEQCARLAPNACLLEGYGITECSPVVSANRPEHNRPGSLGLPIPGVEVCVVDLDTGEPLPPGHQGMLLVSGPTIFPGYIGFDGPSPFRERHGKRWYVTGDLAKIDEEGVLWFAGRLKRFLKAGGEMISLPALEEPFVSLYPANDDGPRVAVEGIETPDGRRIVLFTTEPISLREANARLQEQGFRGIMRLDEVCKLDAIPVLGTGKTDYKALRAMLGSGQLP
jgi:long-chain-fatty-acid--[acyl-carrier-protein] ligase